MSEVGAVGTCVSRDVVKVVRSVLGPGSVMGGATHDRHMVPVITAFEANSWQCHMSGRGPFIHAHVRANPSRSVTVGSHPKLRASPISSTERGTSKPRAP